jgi:hypothetical protein
MESYFGKIKSKRNKPFVYTYSNYREYIETQHNHIRLLETTIDTLIQDIALLDFKIKAITQDKIKD